MTRDTNCPDGRCQRLCHPLGFWERNVEELELRVPLGPGEDGVCQVIVDEGDEEVYVRVLVHSGEEHESATHHAREYTDCPVRVWLDEPLGERAVIDFDLDEELRLYKPLYLDNVRQRDHGYYYVRRRQSASRRPTETRPRVLPATPYNAALRAALDDHPGGQRE